MEMLAMILAEAPIGNASWLEQLSWGANVFLAIAAFIALYQVRAAIKQAKCALEQNRIALEQLEVSRADIQLRSRREAISVALEQCKRFAETIVPHLDILNRELTAKKLSMPTNVDPTFPLLDEKADPIAVKVWVEDPELRMRIVHVLNELESFAMYFSSDIADESVAFTPSALTFCQSCDFLRLFIGVFRQPEKIKLYQNLVKLYGIWKPRLDRTVLEEQGKLLEEKIQKIPADKRGVPIGTNFPKA